MNDERQLDHIRTVIKVTATTGSKVNDRITQMQLYGGDGVDGGDDTGASRPLRTEVVNALVGGGFKTSSAGTGSFLELCYQNGRLDLFEYVIDARPEDWSADTWFHGLCTGRSGWPHVPVRNSMPNVIADDIRPHAADFMRWYVENRGATSELMNVTEHSPEAASLVLQALLSVSISRARRTAPEPTSVVPVEAAVAAAPPAPAPAPASRPKLRLVV